MTDHDFSKAFVDRNKINKLHQNHWKISICLAEDVYIGNYLPENLAQTGSPCSLLAILLM